MAVKGGNWGTRSQEWGAEVAEERIGSGIVVVAMGSGDDSGSLGHALLKNENVNPIVANRPQ